MHCPKSEPAINTNPPVAGEKHPPTVAVSRCHDACQSASRPQRKFVPVCQLYPSWPPRTAPAGACRNDSLKMILVPTGPSCVAGTTELVSTPVSVVELSPMLPPALRPT